MEIEINDSKIWLQEEFSRRKRRNNRYSLRMLAQKLDLSPGRLSELLSGKRKITQKVAKKIAVRLEYTPEQQERFLNTIENQYQNNTREKTMVDGDFKQLPSDSFYVVADWYHFAILSLMELDDFDSSPRWIARRLGISFVEANSALQRLIRLDLVQKDAKGRLTKQHANLTTTHDLESVALKKSHKQSLEQAMDAIDDVSVEFRDITSITMSIDVEKLPKAKKMIKEFRRQLCVFLESGPKKSEVYNLNVQLVPVSKKLKVRSKK